MSTSACTFGPCFFARAAMNAVLQQSVQFRAIELLRVRQLAKRGEDLCRTDHPALPRIVFQWNASRASLTSASGTRRSRPLRSRSTATSAPVLTFDPRISTSCDPPAERRGKSRSPDDQRTAASPPRVRSGRSTPGTTPRSTYCVDHRAPAIQPRLERARRARAVIDRDLLRRPADRCEPRAAAACACRRAAARPGRIRARQALDTTMGSSASFTSRRGNRPRTKKCGEPSPTLHARHRRDPSVRSHVTHST